jgi:hypothetical protein
MRSQVAIIGAGKMKPRRKDEPQINADQDGLNDRQWVERAFFVQTEEDLYHPQITQITQISFRV